MAIVNEGTLVTSPIRPTDDVIFIASVYSNEAQGGHHMYATIDERGTIGTTGIIEPRRQWGMLCTVYNDTDPANNGTYQLVYNAASPNITDNLNWKIFSGGPSVLPSGEWIPSVSDVIDTTPGSTPSQGTRFLIATPSYGVFQTQSDRVAQWDNNLNSGSGGYVYTTPSDGTTMRVDSQKNALYKFSGTWSEGGVWTKEYLSQIRYIRPVSEGGLTYSFTSSTITALDAYSYSVYYANFDATCSSSPVLQIDGLGYYNMKKSNGSQLINLASNDIVPNIQYQISWNIDNFLVHGLGSVGGSAGVIGEPEDGTYEDGLYTDLTASTPIGVPIDRFNEILLALVPPPAPDLKEWSLSGPSFVDGKLSFDNTVAGFSAAPGFNKGDLFASSGTRKGINSGVSQPRIANDIYYQDITGFLNHTVGAGPGQPNPAYSAQAFGNGITGSLILKFNSFTISNINLASKPAVDDTNGGATSGLSISAATSSRFPSGTYFETFWWRTGQYRIKKDNQYLRSGFNYIELIHSLPTRTINVASYSWVSDWSSTQTTFTSEGINTISVSRDTPASPGGVKYLSGVKFFNLVSLNYRVTYSNHPRNTYSSATDAIIAYTDNVSSSVNPITGNVTNTSAVIMSTKATSGPLSIPVSEPSTQITNKDWEFQLNTGVRRLNESIVFKTRALRTVQGTDTSGGLNSGGWYIDNFFGPPPTDTRETFETETTYRLSNGTTKYESGLYDTTTSLSSSYDSKKSLLDAPGYTNQLQICNGVLIYPKYDFNLGDVDKNPNKDNLSVKYSLCNTVFAGHAKTNSGAATNYRTFTRFFRVDPNTNYAQFRFVFSLVNTIFVNADTDLDNNECWIEIKIPKDPDKPNPPGGLEGNAVTGWMDMTKKFDPNPPGGLSPWRNGAGCYRGTPTATQIDVDLGGGKSTGASNGYIVFRLTASPNWNGYIENIELSTL